MTPLSLRHWPDKVLKVPCKEVPAVNADTRAFAREMLQLMYDHDGIGLAAPQVGVSVRLFVMDVWWPQTGSRGRGMVFVNPVVTPSMEKTRTREGCLSLPGVNEFVTRGLTCKVSALDQEGNPFTMEVGGLAAICIQHECDHLDGFTIAERVGKLTRRMILKQLPSVMPPPLIDDD
jgi:peptide deformylase